jgi:hypothetical protein
MLKLPRAMSAWSGAGRSRRAVGARMPVLAALIALLAAPAAATAGRGWIEDPSGRTALQVAFRGTPTYQDVAEIQAALRRMASLVCDATEGQVRIAQIRLTSSPASEDVAALWIHDTDAASGGPYDADGGSLRCLGAHMDVFASARLRPDRLAHLLAHHAFGLGDQYDDQRHRGEGCGFGPGFEPSRLDESNHSIMQGAGGMRCADGPMLDQECLRDDECAGAPCRAMLASEFSAPLNHDLRRGDGSACPRPSAVSRIRLGGLLPSTAEPVAPLDAKDFLAARATSVWQKSIEVLGPSGTLPGIRLQFSLSHLSRLVWQLTIAADASDFGGPRGRFQQLRTWEIRFNDDFSLAGTTPADMHFQLPPSAGRGPVEVAVDLGTRNPDAARDPGHGYDGLQMVAAGVVGVDVAVDGMAGCSAAWCASSWDSRTGRWELTEQSALHDNASDWQTVARNLPFLQVPPALPVDVPPPVCAVPPQFVNDVMGEDQVVFVVDASRSMGVRVDGRAGEVCGTGTDDDGDGLVDEADCADSRLEYEKVAVRAVLALADDRELQAGIVTMSTDAEVASDVQEVDGAHRAALGAVLGSIHADGDTALGTAMEAAQQALKKVERVGGSRTVILMTDGVRNVGVEPGQEARLVDPLIYRVFPVAVGRAAGEMALSAIAARSGGVAYSTALASGMPALLAELAARHNGSALLLPRTTFELARPGRGVQVPSREFEIPVEEKARELVVFLSSRNDRIDDWRLFFELQSPDGERVDDASPEVHAEKGFVVARVSDPRPGRWRLRVLPAGRGEQRSELLAYTMHPLADFFVDAEPRLASVSRPVRLAARPSYRTDLDGDVTVDGVVRRPDGSEVPVTLQRHPLTQAWGTAFSQYAGRGLYQVRLELKVGAGARPALGEPIFPGPSRVLQRVVPFERTAMASFYVADGPMPSCSGNDCDGDGLPDKAEATCPNGEDADGDGVPNRYDADSDNDEIFDGEEGTADVDRNGIPDFCEPETTPDSLETIVVTDEAALAAACGDDAALSRAGLRVSLSATHRIVQVVRTRDGIPPELRADLLQQLAKVVDRKKQAAVIGEVLPEFCRKYQDRLGEALAIERELRPRIDPWLKK